MTRIYRVWRSLLAAACRRLSPPSVHGQSGSHDARTRSRTSHSAQIGPGLTSGRIADVAIDPKNPSVWYVAAAVGDLWKTENRGNTFTPVFDDLRVVLARRRHRRSARFEYRLAWHRREQQPAQRRALATASTNPPMPARPGSGWGSRIPSTFRTSSSIRETRTSSTSPRSDRCGRRRRSRPVQNDRRRTDVEGGADHQSRHGRHRHGDGSEEAGRHLRRRAISAGARSVS